MTICLDEDMYKSNSYFFDSIFVAFQKENIPLTDDKVMYIYQINQEFQPHCDYLIHFDPQRRGEYFRLVNVVRGYIEGNLQCTILHGSLVQMNKKNILIMGTRMSGKTTLVRLLLKEFDAWYVDDDCVYIVESMYRGFHMPVFVRGGEYSCTTHTTIDEENVVRQVYVPEKRIEAVKGIDVILFPHFRKGNELTVQKVKGFDLFHAIINNTRNHCDKKQLMYDIVRLASQTDAYEIAFGDSEQIERFVNGI